MKLKKIFLNAQIDYFIQDKYNFIHYNGWPNVIKAKELEENIDIRQFLERDEVAKRKTKNQEIATDLIRKLNKNLKNNINSPFKNEVIVIDEVHNLINMINGKKTVALKFYEWIKDSDDTKLIFLSGTPIVNKPCEIAILFNMLKGKITTYSFSIKTDGDINDITRKLKEIYYRNTSTIEQLYVTKKQGKIVVSFIKNKSNFRSILDKETNTVKTIKYNNFTLDEFFDEIYKGLHHLFDKDLIIPKTVKAKDLTENTKYDREANIIFNRSHALFDIFEDDKKIDMTENENFINYFFDESIQIPEEKQIFLRRLLMGLTSHFPIGKTAVTDMPQIVEVRSIANL